MSRKNYCLIAKLQYLVQAYLRYGIDEKLIFVRNPLITEAEKTETINNNSDRLDKPESSGYYFKAIDSLKGYYITSDNIDKIKKKFNFIAFKNKIGKSVSTRKCKFIYRIMRRKELQINKSILNEFYPKSFQDLESIIRINEGVKNDIAKYVTDIYIIKRINENHEYSAIQERLITLGFNRNEASLIFSAAKKKLRYLEDQESSRSKILVGIVLIGLGGILSLLSYVIANVSGAGFYFVSYGFIAFGVYYILSGIKGIYWFTDYEKLHLKPKKKKELYTKFKNTKAIKTIAIIRNWFVLLLSFFPIVGWYVFLVNRKSNVSKAKASLLLANFGFAFLILYILLTTIDL